MCSVSYFPPFIFSWDGLVAGPFHVRVSLRLCVCSGPTVVVERVRGVRGARGGSERIARNTTADTNATVAAAAAAAAATARAYRRTSPALHALCQHPLLLFRARIRMGLASKAAGDERAIVTVSEVLAARGRVPLEVELVKNRKAEAAAAKRASVRCLVVLSALRSKRKWDP